MGPLSLCKNSKPLDFTISGFTVGAYRVRKSGKALIKDVNRALNIHQPIFSIIVRIHITKHFESQLY